MQEGNTIGVSVITTLKKPTLERATLPPGLQSLRSANVTIQLPSFPFGCYTNPGLDTPDHSQSATAIGLLKPAIELLACKGAEV